MSLRWISHVLREEELQQTLPQPSEAPAAPQQGHALRKAPPNKYTHRRPSIRGSYPKVMPPWSYMDTEGPQPAWGAPLPSMQYTPQGSHRTPHPQLPPVDRHSAGKGRTPAPPPASLTLASATHGRNDSNNPCHHYNHDMHSSPPAAGSGECDNSQPSEARWTRRDSRRWERRQAPSPDTHKPGSSISYTSRWSPRLAPTRANGKGRPGRG